MNNYDTQVTAVRTNDCLLLRRHAVDGVFCEEYAFGEQIVMRTPLVETIGDPEPGLPMRQQDVSPEMIEMFSTLVAASESDGEVTFATEQTTGSYRRESRQNGHYVFTELLSSGSGMSVSRVRFDVLDMQLLRVALDEARERREDA